MRRVIFKTIGIVIGASVLPLIMELLLKYRHRKKMKKIKSKTQMEQDNNYYYQCLFWTFENLNCREHMYNNTECGDRCPVSQLQTLVNLITSAKTSVDLCMYHLTLRQVTDELISARNRGVTVRVISDTVTSKMEHSKIKRLKEMFGIDVRTPAYYENSYMHHKYCVIDAKDTKLQKMFLGTLNLTLQACLANFEFVTITNNAEMINSFSEEFEFLWNDFEEFKSY